MIKKILLTIVFASAFLFPKTSLAEINYQRNPSGTTIFNPVSFHISFGSFSEVCSAPNEFWSLAFLYYGADWTEIETVRLPSTVLEYTFTPDLPLADYYIQVWGYCSVLEIGGNSNAFSVGLFEEGWPAFSVIESPTIPPEESKIFALPAGALASSTAYIGDLVTDAWPFISLAIGIPLAFYVVRKLIYLTKTKK